MEQIVVTGSRIATTNLESPSPLQIVGAEDIDSTGVANIQDLLLKTPAFGTPGISRTNSNFSTSSAGVATVDLRNLGTSRTLVLVNGRRFVAGIPGETAVDLNTIPTQFIERVDILTGGASAVYGSDAIAGVVNIIYKKNFEGVEFDGQYGITNQGDGDETQFSMTMGTDVADGKGNIIAHLGYSDQGAVYSRDRARSKTDQSSYAAVASSRTRDPDRLFEILRPYYSSYAPTGHFYNTGNPDGLSDWTYTEVGGDPACWSTNGSASCTAKGFNRSEFRTIAIPTERYLAAVSGTYEMVENHSAFLEATYASTQAKTELEPFPLAAENVYPQDGYVPIQFETFTPNGAGGYTRTVLDNPMVPRSVFDNTGDGDGDGLKDIYFTRRMSEIGNRGNVADRDTFRVVGGLQGELEVLTNWNYEAFYAYGQTKEAQTSSGQVNVLNMRYALEAVPDVNDVDGDFNVTEAICRDPYAREQGCVPISIYGPGAISAAGVDYIKAPGLLTTFTSQKVAGLNVSGEPVDLWAGPLGVAFGVEYREEYARSEFDPLQQAGLNAGNAIPRTEGDFHVFESYIEARLPLLNDVFLAEQLDLNGAIRFSDYSTVGSTQSWNVGLEWAPIPQVRFRGVRAEAMRAPNINELYSPPSQNFPTGLVDPCTSATLTGTDTLSVNCRSFPGVVTNMQANGGLYVLNQSDVQGVSGYDRGNPDLSEEKGKSWTVGVVITPDSIPVLENFGFTIDYFDIDISDAIVSTDRQFILDTCAKQKQFCDFITRRPDYIGANSAGSLEFVDTAVTNSGGLGTSGIDFTVTYAQDLFAGTFNARLAYTHLLDGYVKDAPGAAKNPFAGEIGASEDRAYLTLGYNWGDLGITWGVSYIGEAYLDDQYLASFDCDGDGLFGPNDTDGRVACKPESYGVDDAWYHDVQVTWSPGDIVELYVGATNLFDEAPQPVLSNLPGNDTGTETNAGTYDAIGQRFYGGFRVKF